MSKMARRQLGRTNADVSAYALGVMTFGSQTEEAEAFRILDMALDAGITFFDTAENYPSPIDAATHGRSEQILGDWIARRNVRDRVRVATKVAGPGNAAGDMTHIRGANRRLDAKNIARAVDDSLRRLKLDTIDLYQVHWSERPISTLGRSRFSHVCAPEGSVPILETLRALDDAVRAGKIQHVGMANETPWGLSAYLEGARAEGLPRVVTIQNSYSLLDRYFELGLAEYALQEHVGLLAYSPLAGGILTGKYLASRAALPGSRSSLSAGFERRLTASKINATAAYAALAKEHGLELGAMALAFVQQQPFVTSVLMAARNTDQMRQNLGAIALTLPIELIRQINAIHDSNPNPR